MIPQEIFDKGERIEPMSDEQHIRELEAEIKQLQLNVDLLHSSSEVWKRRWNEVSASNAELKKEVERLKDDICPECGQGLITHSCDTPPEGVCLVCAAREEIPALTAERDELKAEVERLKEQRHRSGVAMGQMAERVDALTAERDELKRTIDNHWYVETEDGKTKCFYCGEEVIDEDEQYRPKHPQPSDCIVLRCHPKEAETK